MRPRRASAFEQRLVDAPVERRELQPLLQMRKDLVAGRLPTRCSSSAAWQPRKRRRCAMSQPSKTGLRSISSPSRRSPANSAGQRSQPLRRQASRCPSWVARVDLDAHRRSSPRGRAGWCRRPRLDPAPAGLIDDAPELAEAPAELAARIVGHVPQQLAELAAGHRVRGQRQIGEQRAHLARCRQRSARPRRG